MKRALVFATLAACIHPGSRPAPAEPTAPHMAWGLVLHGGAGVITRDKLTPELVDAVVRDAAIMDGRAHTAGAVAGVRTIKNPILLARR